MSDKFSVAFSENFVTPVARIRFGRPYKLEEYEGQIAYRATVYVPRSAASDELFGKVSAFKEKHFGNSQVKTCMNLATDEDYPKNPELVGHYVIKAHTNEKNMKGELNDPPKLFDLDRVRLPSDELEVMKFIYPGALVRIGFTPFTFYKSKDVRGVTSILKFVQFIQHGKKFGDTTEELVASQVVGLESFGDDEF